MVLIFLRCSDYTVYLVIDEVFQAGEPANQSVVLLRVKNFRYKIALVLVVPHVHKQVADLGAF